jgi:hypothetical protein
MINKYLDELREVAAKLREVNKILDEVIKKTIEPMPEYQEKLLLTEEYERLSKMIGL